jgi:membrane-anchored mycosin MYCP
VAGLRRILAAFVVGSPLALTMLTVTPAQARGMDTQARPAVRVADTQCATPGRSVPGTSWALGMLAPAQVWPLTSGGNQTVAVLDSGVDATQPLLRRRVERGYDAVTGGGRANDDCLGTGTHVAGAVAGARSGSSGMAPAARIVPVRVIGEPGPNMSAIPTATALARGITWAANDHVSIIDVSVWLTRDDPAVRDAVNLALADGIIVVAAAGDLGSDDGGNPVTYPAAYPGVIGVGAVDESGQAWEAGEHGSYVDLVAPGVGVPALQRGHGLVSVDGSTALAAGFVSGAAALVRARWPHEHRTQVTARLLGTASPTAGGTAYGRGIVNAYLAVTSTPGDGAPSPVPGLRRTRIDTAQAALAAERRHSRALATEWTMIALGALLVVVLLAVGVPRARRRAWRATYARPLIERPEPMEPEPVALLFDEA